MDSAIVQVDKPESMNLLGLILRDLIIRNLDKPQNRERYQSVFGDVEIRCGDMQIVLSFNGQNVSINREPKGKVRSRISGNLKTFLNVALGKGIIKPFLKGDLKVSGNPFFVLKLLPLLKASNHG